MSSNEALLQAAKESGRLVIIPVTIPPKRETGAPLLTREVRVLASRPGRDRSD